MIMLTRDKNCSLECLLTQFNNFSLNKFCLQICKALAIDPARPNTSKGALFSIALTVRGQESVIQK
ncbi:hypothetical protein Fmac_033010 [Flemingia macrophylla]|uniref:Uncharacterized protein n=1 Tax=Flemingia macrophylla TaxID=520843 RepID=A0ABD1L6J5_9FABA